MMKRTKLSYGRDGLGWCLVLGAFGAWCVVPGAWCAVRGAWCLVHGCVSGKWSLAAGLGASCLTQRRTGRWIDLKARLDELERALR